MSDRLFYALAALAAVILITAAVVWPQRPGRAAGNLTPAADFERRAQGCASATGATSPAACPGLGGQTTAAVMRTTAAMAARA